MTNFQKRFKSNLIYILAGFLSFFVSFKLPYLYVAVPLNILLAFFILNLLYNNEQAFSVLRWSIRLISYTNILFPILMWLEDYINKVLLYSIAGLALCTQAWLLYKTVSSTFSYAKIKFNR